MLFSSHNVLTEYIKCDFASLFNQSMWHAELMDLLEKEAQKESSQVCIIICEIAFTYV